MNETYGHFLLRDGGLALALLVAWLWPSFGTRFFAPIEHFGSRLGARKAGSVLAVAILVLILRLSVLPLVKISVPQVHDEFSYLLAADTFAHGRLANPQSPMWVFFETFHVNQIPTYASKYPPGQGAVLALGQVLGHPWIGVLLSVACLCGAITWALQGWMAPRWAFLGGILAVAQFGVRNYWMESYWGGAVAATGGALLMGAFPRILRHQRVRDATLFATGIGILANSRPYEGCVFSVTLMAALVLLLMRRRMIDRHKIFVNVVVPIAATLMFVGAFIGYYNWRVTGNPLLLPYIVNNRTYLDVPIFRWQRLGPPHQYMNPQFESFYNSQRARWSQEHFDWTLASVKIAFLEKLGQLQGFYAPPQLGIPIIVALFSLPRNKKVRFCSMVCVPFIASLLSLLWIFPHYAAPFTATLYVLIVFGFRYLWHWSFRGRPVGLGLTRAFMLFYVLLLVARIVAPAVSLHGVAQRDDGWAWAQARAQMEARLESMPGQHLVLVQYSPGHDPNREWVYNRADIDDAKVVWAREIPGRDIDPLLRYFRGRHLWVVEPDAASGPRLEPVWKHRQIVSLTRADE